jgi:hypothetical protein
VAVDDSGDAFAVWEQLDGDHRRIWGGHDMVGTDWSAPVALDPDELGNAGSPRLAVDGRGRGMAVFERSLGTATSIWAARWDGGWTVAAPIDPGETAGYLPELALDQRGNALAVWKRASGTGFIIMAARYLSGQGWGAPEALSGDAGSTDELALGMAPGGDAVLIWAQSGSIRTRRFLAAGGWQSEIVIEPGADSPAAEPDVSMDAAGNAVAVWTQHTGGGPQVWASRYQVGDVWLGRTPIQVDSTDWGTRPRVAAAMDGDAVAVWLEGVPGNRRVWASRFTGATRQWAPSQPVATAEDGLDPAVGLDLQGNAVAVWTQATSLGQAMQSDVVSNRSSVGDDWLIGRRLNALNSWGSEARVAVAPSGDAVAVWTSGTELYANHFR